MIETDGKVVGNICIFLQKDVYAKLAEFVRIYADPFDRNAASKSVLEKAGFTYEGTMRNGIYKNGEVQSYCIYLI